LPASHARYHATQRTRSTRPEELHSLLTDAVLVRRLKADILQQLPPKRRCVVRVLSVEDEEKGLADVGTDPNSRVARTKNQAAVCMLLAAGPC
jgi:hypothetical protein